MRFCIMIALLAVSYLANAQTYSSMTVLDSHLKNKLNNEIEFIGSLFGTVYAPKAWKEDHLGWNLQAQIDTAKAQLSSAQTMREARQAIAGLIRSTADYHVGFGFYSTEKAVLPFQVKTIEGKTIIVYIEREQLSETAFPFSVGDEVISFDGAPVAEILKSIRESMGFNVQETDAAIADLYLTRRSARANLVVPSGPVTVAIQRAQEAKVRTVQLVWDYTPERLQNWTRAAPNVNIKKDVINRKMISPVAMQLADIGEKENPFAIGAKKSFLTDFGPRIWQTAEDNTFDAYIYRNEQGQLIGVVRIFAYSLEDYSKAVKDFAAIISHMEKLTSALIIDQNNNPGGSVFYLYALASMLTDQVLAVPKHREALSVGEAKECSEVTDVLASVKSDEDATKALGTDFSGYPVTYQLAVGIRDYCRRKLDQFKEGRGLSEPLFLWGVDKINPHSVHYTKPIVVLVNELDFSGGDFFPAILQDNKRAKIVGTRTAGAGGYVLGTQFPNSFGLESISFTGSIAERVDKNPLENLGVSPDVVLPLTLEDLRGGYQVYKKAVSEIVADLIK